MTSGMGTSLSCTSHLSTLVEEMAWSGRHVVTGMPPRHGYEADQGWDMLMLPYVKDKERAAAPRTRQGATGRPYPGPGSDAFGYVDPSDFVPPTEAP